MMMKTRRYKTVSCLILLYFAIFFTQTAYAALIPVTGVYVEPYNTGFGTAEVHSQVFQDDVTSDYHYTYQILNSSNLNLSFFSVGMPDNALPSTIGDDSTGVVPISEVLAGIPCQSADFLFGSTIGNSQQSALLWFISPNAPAPDFGYGILFGTSSGIPYPAIGDVYVPLPEPATIALLGTGVLFGCCRKNKRV